MVKKQTLKKTNDIDNIISSSKDNANKHNSIYKTFKYLSKWILRVIQGIIIGAGAILPGISGGVLCVVFGLYQPMMAVLAHPIKTFKIYSRLLFPVLIGWFIGFVGLAGAVYWMFSVSNNMAVWLFIGLIAGMVPSLYKDAGKEGRPKSAWISLIASTILIFAFLLLFPAQKAIEVQPTIWSYLFCGVLWGISLVAPGMSSSSLLIYMGIYAPMTAGIKNFDMFVILPMTVGIFFIIFVSARAINYLFKKHYAIAFHIILGFVIASTLAIIPWVYNGLLDALFNLLCFIGGFVIAWLMDKLAQKMHYREEHASE